jgi:hypothetical protein
MLSNVGSGAKGEEDRWGRHDNNVGSFHFSRFDVENDYLEVFLGRFTFNHFLNLEKIVY